MSDPATFLSGAGRPDMATDVANLLAASTAFVGTHFALSHPLRRGLVGRLGRGGFMALYSLVAFATLFWAIAAFRALPSPDLPGSGIAGWWIATLLTLPAMVLLVGSFRGNPALPAPGAEQAATKQPRGVFTVTRHPMMWGIALWAIAHIVLFWSVRTLIFAGAMLVLALLGAHLQDRKKRSQMGEAWRGWEAKTSYWPRLGRLPSAGWLVWLLGAALWLAATWAHIHAGGVPAGVWRWAG